MSEKKINFKSMLLKYFLCYLAIILVVFLIVFYAAPAGEREELWSQIMLFVNFGILVFLYVRFANKPLVKLLRNQGGKIGEKLKSVEADVKEARSRMEEEAKKLKNIDNNLAAISENIIAAGNREKENVIERAQTLADKMISDAKKEAEFKLLAAKKRFSEEMLDAAIRITTENIKQNITREDDEKLINEFSSGLDGEQNIPA